MKTEVAPQNQDAHDKIRSFYDDVYYKNLAKSTTVSGHLRRLAFRLKITRNDRVLDVGCGAGEWLYAVQKMGGTPVGVDLSTKAIEACRTTMPNAEFHCGPAEALPFGDETFDVVSCLGSMEHFIDPSQALGEIVRVAKRDARFLLLVPNADFLTRRLGFFRGTHQVEAKEHVRTLRDWQVLFEAAGLKVVDRWKDLHVVSRRWILMGPWHKVPLRAVQAATLCLWPLGWQYQVYYRCSKRMDA